MPIINHTSIPASISSSQNNISRKCASQKDATQHFNEYLLSHFLKMVYKPNADNEGAKLANEILINEYARQITQNSNGVRLIKNIYNDMKNNIDR
jgi:hypothetical protein